ncbi:uncharacterized protein LOC105219124 [Zeugodacus cucurbitae]|uniref:uncharacterized protein LOC105219124 n=1 Tax=Zeugodacus cucurbitae TaxID=28588 RepID=UPI0005968812|nr:uncharacterized protein LOC105219124 [Zeugodacus cucurbitae]
MSSKILLIIGAFLISSARALNGDMATEGSLRTPRSAQWSGYPPPPPPGNNGGLPQRLDRFMGGLESEFRQEFNRPGSPYQRRPIREAKPITNADIEVKIMKGIEQNRKRNFR